MIKTQIPFDETSWPQFEKLIIDNINAYYQKHIWDKKGNEVQSSIDNCQEAHRKYKKEFSWALYYFIIFCLPFSVILIIPAYWCIKKFSEMKRIKNELKATFDLKNDERVRNLKKILGTINFYDIICAAYEQINYQPKGPVSGHVLDLIKKHYPKYENNWIINKNNHNTFSSSWGVFNKHMLIFNMANKVYWNGEKTYSASKTFFYTTTDSKGNITTHSEILTAYHTEDFPEYKTTYKVGVFTNVANDLNFESNFDDKSKKIDKRNNQTSFENKEFNKNFCINRNNEALVRMFYTADVQEYLVSKLDKYKKSKSLPSYYWWNKNGPIASSEMSLVNPHFLRSKYDAKTFDKVDLELKDFLDYCSKLMMTVIHERFVSLNCATSLPSLLTEYDDYIITELDKISMPNMTVDNKEAVYAQSVLCAIWNETIIKTDADVMFEPKIIAKVKIGKIIFTQAEVLANGFTGIHRTALVTVSGINTGVHIINVPYVEYVPKKETFFMAYAQMKCFAFYEDGKSDHVKIVELVEKFGLECKIKLKYDHIVFIDNDNDFLNFKNFFAELKTYIDTIE